MQRKELPRHFPLGLKDIATKKASLDGIFNIDELGFFSNQISSKACVSDWEAWAQVVKALGMQCQWCWLGAVLETTDTSYSGYNSQGSVYEMLQVLRGLPELFFFCTNPVTFITCIMCVVFQEYMCHVSQHTILWSCRLIENSWFKNTNLMYTFSVLYTSSLSS